MIQITLKLYANLPKIFGFKEKLFAYPSPISVTQFIHDLRQENSKIDQYFSKFLTLPEKQQKNFIHITLDSKEMQQQESFKQLNLSSSATIAMFPPLNGG